MALKKQSGQIADISFELYHHYACPSEKLDKEALASAARMAKPLLNAWQERGITVSTCIMIDNISRSTDQQPMDTKKDRADIISEFDQEGIEVNFICDEGGFTNYAKWMHGQIIQVNDPENLNANFGQETTIEDASCHFEQYWVDGVDVKSKRRGHLYGQAVEAKNPFNFNLRRTIGVSAPLWRMPPRGNGPIVYSCPMLAATWQAMRLGLLKELPETYEAHEHSAYNTTPIEVEIIGEENKPFAANATISLLEPSYIPVEHAVSRILKLVDFPEKFVTSKTAKEKISWDRYIDTSVNYLFASKLIG